MAHERLYSAHFYNVFEANQSLCFRAGLDIFKQYHSSCEPCAFSEYVKANSQATWFTGSFLH